MPTTVSDTFAFACSRAEAWDIVHSDPRSDLGLDDAAMVRAFQAAKEHVDASVTGLLLTTWTAFVEEANKVKNTTRYDGLKDRAPDSRTLMRWRSWSKQLVGTRAKELSVGVSIEKDRAGERLAIYAFVRAPEAHLDTLEDQLATTPSYFVRDETWLYVSEQILTEGDPFASVAQLLVRDAWPVIERASLLLSPPRGRNANGR